MDTPQIKTNEEQIKRRKLQWLIDRKGISGTTRYLKQKDPKVSYRQIWTLVHKLKISYLNRKEAKKKFGERKPNRTDDQILEIIDKEVK